MGRRGGGKNKRRDHWRDYHETEGWGPAQYREAVQWWLKNVQDTRAMMGYGETAARISEVVGESDAETIDMTPEMLWEFIAVIRVAMKQM